MTKSKETKNTNNSPSFKDKIKNFSLKKQSFPKPFIAASFLLFGIGGTLLTQSLANDSKPSANQQIEMLTQWQKEVNQWMKDFHKSQIDMSDRFFDDFYSADPFAEIDQVHKRMRERFANFDKYFSDNFSDLKSRSATNRTQISQREGDKFLYYQLNFKGFDKDDVVTEIKDNILTFSAKKSDKKALEEKGVNSQFRSNSNFLYSFSLPKYVDTKNPEFIREDSKIVVKLRKNNYKSNF